MAFTISSSSTSSMSHYYSSSSTFSDDSPKSSTFSDDSPKSPTFSDDSPKSSTIKFLCSYGGLILPRFPDGHLRYVGGHNRVLSLPRSTSFSDLTARLGELSGYGDRVSFRCKLPTEDLDALVSVTCDEELASLIEEYEFAATPRKIRIFLHAPARSPKAKAPSPPPHRCHVRYGWGWRPHSVHGGYHPHH